jgi:hypothetical protein
MDGKTPVVEHKNEDIARELMTQYQAIRVG